MNAQEAAQLVAEVNAEDSPVPFDVILDAVMQRIHIAASFGRSRLQMRRSDFPPHNSIMGIPLDGTQVLKLFSELRTALIADQFQVQIGMRTDIVSDDEGLVQTHTWVQDAYAPVHQYATGGQLVLRIDW